MTDPWYITFQPAISALVGFGGVIVTLFTNAYLQRRAEYLREERQRISAINALSAELEHIKKSLEAAIDFYQSGPEKDGAHYFFSDVRTFQGMMFQEYQKSMGLMSKDTAQKVVRAYWACRHHEKFAPKVNMTGSSDGDVWASHADSVFLAEISYQTKTYVDEAIEALDLERSRTD